jgi:hypothetical protein
LSSFANIFVLLYFSHSLICILHPTIHFTNGFTDSFFNISHSFSISSSTFTLWSLLCRFALYCLSYNMHITVLKSSHFNLELKASVSEISSISIVRINIDPNDGDRSLKLWFLVQHWYGWSPENILAHLFSVKASNLTQCLSLFLNSLAFSVLMFLWCSIC